MILPNQLKNSTNVLPKKSGIILPQPRAGVKPDLTTTEGLVQQAKISGVGKEAEKIVSPTNKLSVLQRVGKGLGAFGTAQAVITTSKKGLVAGVREYGKDIVQELGSAVTGQDFGGEKATYRDVVEKLGIENSILKFGLGVVGDIFLDPSTYFGAAIAKGIGKGVGAISKVAKVIPGVEKVAEATKSALGKGFVYGYGTSKGLPEKALEIQSQLAKTKEGIVASNLARLGTGVLSKGQQGELVEKLLAGKRAEFAVGKGTEEAATAGKLAAQSTNPLIQKTIEAQALRSQRFAKSAGIKDP